MIQDGPVTTYQRADPLRAPDGGSDRPQPDREAGAAYRSGALFRSPSATTCDNGRTDGNDQAPRRGNLDLRRSTTSVWPVAPETDATRRDPEGCRLYMTVRLFPTLRLDRLRPCTP